MDDDVRLGSDRLETGAYPSLDALRSAHGDLLQLHRERGDTPKLLDQAETFIRRGRATGALLDGEDDRWASQSLLDYWAAMSYRLGREPPDAALAEFDPLQAPELDDRLCPYRGLDAFRQDHHAAFFGRQRLVDEMLQRLAQERLLAVIGPSGSGKSSLVLAGLLPALQAGAVPGSQDWRYLAPMVPGSQPLANLARLFRPADAEPAQWMAEQIERLQQDPTHLAQLAGASGAPTVLVVDQFEELFTLCLDEVQRVAFVNNLMGLIQAPDARHTVILTLRTDFEPRVAALAAFYPLFEAALQRVTPLNAAELRAAIEKPAQAVGLKFADGVVEALLRDILGEPAALPLLQFTLLKLWEHRERNRVTLEAYHRLGGGRLALARSADEFYEGLIPEEQVTVRRILLRMARPGEGLEVTSNRVRRETLYRASEAHDRIDRVLAKLVQVRLVRLTPGETPADDQVEVAHEALVRNWPRLVVWLEDERVSVRQRLRLSTAAEQWEALGKHPDALLRGPLLAEALHYEDLHELELEFVRASQAAILRRQRLRQIAVLTIMFLLALAAIIAERERRRADRLAHVALSRQLAAQSYNLFDDQLDLALLLSLEAYQTTDTAEAQASLITGLEFSPHLANFLRGHDDSVLSVAVSPDGETLATGGADDVVRLWDLETRQPRGDPLIGHTANVISLAFSPDGRTLASASFDGSIILWDVASGEAVTAPLTEHTEEVRSVSFSPDGQTLASGSFDDSIILWDLAADPPVGRVLGQHGTSVYAVAFSPDGATLASGDRDGHIFLWEVATGQQIAASLGHSESVFSLAFSPNGNLLASGGKDNLVRLWDLATREPLGEPLTGHEADVYSVAFGPDGDLLVSASRDTTVRLWDVLSGSAVGGPLLGHNGSVYSVAFSPDGETLVSGGVDHNVILWQPPIHVDYALSVAFNREGNILVSGNTDGTIRLWDTKTHQPLGDPFKGHTDDVVSIALSPDGRTLASGSYDGTVLLWDLETGEKLSAYLTDHRDRVRAVAFSSDGTRLATGSYNGTIMLWDLTATPADERTLVEERGAVYALTFSPDDRALVAGYDDGTITLWDVETGAQIEQWMSHEETVFSVAFRPDGEVLASGGRESDIILWDVATGQPLGEPLRAHTSSVYSLTFSPDGHTLASASRDASVILWDVATHEPIGRPLDAHGSAVGTLAFSPDGHTLASSSSDGTIILWDLRFGPQFWQERVCEIVSRNILPDEWRAYRPDQARHKTCGRWPLESE